MRACLCSCRSPCFQGSRVTQDVLSPAWSPRAPSFHHLFQPQRWRLDRHTLLDLSHNNWEAFCFQNRSHWVWLPSSCLCPEEPEGKGMGMGTEYWMSLSLGNEWGINQQALPFILLVIVRHNNNNFPSVFLLSIIIGASSQSGDLHCGTTGCLPVLSCPCLLSSGHACFPSFRRGNNTIQ